MSSWCVKYLQLFASPDAHVECGLVEGLSVGLYLGSLLLVVVHFIFRYLAVAERSIPRLGALIVLATALFASIPVSIASNTTSYAHGMCVVEHPLVSAVLPPTITTIAHALQLAFFAEVLATGNALATFQRRQRRRVSQVAVMLLITNGISILSTVLFHVSLSTSLQFAAPGLSALDLSINHACVVYPVLHRMLARARRVVREMPSINAPSDNGEGSSVGPLSAEPPDDRRMSVTEPSSLTANAAADVNSARTVAESKMKPLEIIEAGGVGKLGGGL
ncbi:hypothetical protein AMAG_15573 [Allomyces macrogynus ATCC 38327]|uniref:G-protein coupled receptors family 1 profile domain-containing protein n=1 Tax=Allomyces macrogynus (strain ATCC 38327) TaxID=578462 RepID=A0A0L0T9E4_ALLM3|nr:hypothetical protein AMAG_15573 [Allomyces macrogynus ATCC 38327]|eukprot:KNE71335.1 hypothetical protein AMAG_15573 [Allomyces macrogynus ATCC 38327]